MLQRYTAIFFIALFSIIRANAGTSVTITWDRVSTDTTGKAESGSIYYQVYGQNFPAFPISPANFLGATRDTSFTHTDSSLADPSTHYFYQVIAMDEWGNRSEASNVKGTAGFVLAKIKVFLQGAYDAGGDTMRTTLYRGGLLPLSSPYPQAPRTVRQMPAGIVDWICVELRNSTYDSVLFRRSFLLKNDGTIVEGDGGTAAIGFPGAAGRSYYLVIKHRNQVAVMSSSAMALSDSGTVLFDFSTGSDRYYGGGATVLKSGVWGMWASDIDQDGEVTTSDYTVWYNSARVGASGYQPTDLDMDGQVTTSDYTIWYNNARAGASSAVP